MTDPAVVIDTPAGIEAVRLFARKGALALEIKGMKRHGRSAYSICKEVYGLRGSRQRVLDQLQEMVDQIQAGDDVFKVINQYKENK